MIDLPKPGAYVLRAPHAGNFSQGLVQHWLDSQEETSFKACLWLTTSRQSDLRNMFEPYLSNKAKAPKGLDVVSVRDVWRQGRAHTGIRQLCRSLNTLCVLKPSLVIVEHAGLWFNQEDEVLSKRNPMAHMRLLHQWALHARASVVTVVQGDLPQWSVFADGLADVNERGDFEFRPWWPTQWGMQTNLWTDTNQMMQLPVHHVLDSQQFGGLKQLAQACHRLRFSDNAASGVHVKAHGEFSSLDASVLLRMGADSVMLNNEDPATWLGLPNNRIQQPDLKDLPDSEHADNFARDLHEIFMPGLLTLVANPSFATHGLMMLELSQRWSMHSTITRLSLMRHMTAQTALRLANWSRATCVFTATREAIYVLKIWVDEPDESDYRQWLGSCFREKLTTLFSGDIQFIGMKEQTELLADLNEELEPLSVEDLMAADPNEPVKLDELWDENRDMTNTNRPWLQRIAQLLSGGQT
ncbi:hypothetical protein [Limnobacter sp.]|uniref:hypothetical protein n=1 Tax=Limnobacter sp. TaxID=2003368 RepID=UPI002FE1499F